jgi:hypothetical protein
MGYTLCRHHDRGKISFPAHGMDGASLYELINGEQANLLLGVPTIWLGLLNYLDSIGATLTR